VSTNNESSRAELASLAVASGQSDAHRRIVAKVEPPTHVVDPYQRGDFATLEEAIKAARPGDRILVRPGLYEGGLVIDKPLEILGDGPVEEIEIRARSSDAVLFKASIGRIANLTLRQAGGNGRWYAVDITQGRLDLEGCDISAQNGTCVGIHGGADPRIRRNRIHDGQRSGVLIYDEGRGTLEDNDIYANAMTGIAIKTGGDPTLRRNRVRDGQQSGVYIYDHGRGTLEDNDIFGNARGGVVITSNGDPTLRRNRIHAGRATGVFLHDGGHATLEENDIDGNALAGVEIKTGSDATMRRNRIHDGKSGGVYIHTSGHGTLEDNDILQQRACGR
jgi:F-box protein 11